jgi:hypothetical protein
MRSVAGFKKENMFIMMVDDSEQHLDQKQYMNKVDITKLVDLLRQEYLQLMTTICLAPHGYDTVL